MAVIIALLLPSRSSFTHARSYFSSERNDLARRMRFSGWLWTSVYKVCYEGVLLNSVSKHIYQHFWTRRCTYLPSSRCLIIIIVMRPFCTVGLPLQPLHLIHSGYSIDQQTSADISLMQTSPLCLANQTRVQSCLLWVTSKPSTFWFKFTPQRHTHSSL